MKRKRIPLLIAGSAMLAVLFAFLANRSPTEHRSARETIDGQTNQPSTEDLDTGGPQGKSTASQVSVEQVNQQIEHARSQLASAASVEQARQILNDLKNRLLSLPPEVASAAIASFLREPDRDVATGIEFKVGRGGSLSGHPSLRVALLDWLAEIDPARAGELAEQVLATPTHPDEWAVCLRNYARAHPGNDNREFLRTKTEEMIRNPVWRENPSVGFLESFDVLVHAHATESAELLGTLVADKSPKGKALAHAAYLAMDRLAIREPVAMMQQFAAHPEISKARGPMVANMFARADLRDPDQRALVRAYLLDPSRTQQELRAFAGVYPNNNYAISKNLLSTPSTAKGTDLAAHDRAALAIVTRWLNDPAFASVKPHIQTMQQRLSTFVGQASK